MSALRPMLSGRLSPSSLALGVTLVLCVGLVLSVWVALWARDLATTQWHAALAARPDAAAPHAGSVTRVPMWSALSAGLCITGCLAAAYLMVARARRRTDRLIQEISESLLSKGSSARAMAESAADAIVVINEHRRVHWSNQRAAIVFGYDPKQLLNLAVPQVLPAFMGQQMASWLQRHGDGTSASNIDTLAVHADGSAFPVTISVSSFRVPGQLLYTCIIRASTNTKAAARELMLRERALASSTNGITIADMKREGWPLIYVNQAFEDLTGYSSQEALGRNARFLQRHDTDQEAVRALRQAISESRSCHVVLRNYRKDGRMFWNDLSIAPVQEPDGQVTHYVGIQVDITERVQAEAALQLRTERLNAVFALSPDGFVALDAQGAVTIVNPAFEGMTGLKATELIGLSAPQFEEALADLCTAGPVPEEGTRRFLETQPGDPADGDRPTATGSADRGPLHSLQQDILHLRTPAERTLLRRTRRSRDRGKETVMVFRDITRELEVDRMKSEFLSTAAHELRTPMSSIYGFAELLLKRPYEPAHQREMLSTIHRQAGVLVNLINELLDLARIEARRGKDFHFEVVELQATVERTVASLLVPDDDRPVTLRLPPEAIRVKVDTEKLSLALTNVLSNAYKYSPDGGDIVLEVVHREVAGQPQVGVSVSDQGMGMTPPQLAQMFDRFYRADASGNIPGTGLGMAIVKEIAELHGGEVTATSRLGEGTTVVIWLPAA